MRPYLSRDVELSFRGLHTVRAKAGTPLRPITGGGGVIYYAISPADVETDSDRSKTSIWAHDTKHFFIYAPADAVAFDDDDDAASEARQQHRMSYGRDPELD